MPVEPFRLQICKSIDPIRKLPPLTMIGRAISVIANACATPTSRLFSPDLIFANDSISESLAKIPLSLTPVSLGFRRFSARIEFLRRTAMHDIFFTYFSLGRNSIIYSISMIYYKQSIFYHLVYIFFRYFWIHAQSF